MSYETESIYMPRILRNQTGDSESAGMPSYLQQQQQGQLSQQQPQQQSSGMGGYHHQQLNQVRGQLLMQSMGFLVGLDDGTETQDLVYTK